MNHLHMDWLLGMVALALLSLAATAMITLLRDRVWLQTARQHVKASQTLLDRDWHASGIPAIGVGAPGVSDAAPSAKRQMRVTKVHRGHPATTRRRLKTDRRNA